MGFTPLDGLVMATRSGPVDPGLVLWLEEHAHVPPRELASALESRSGLAGLAGTGDMKEVLSRAAAGDPRAVLGRDVYLHRLRASIAAMTAALGRLDVLVFTGGVGENSAEIRIRAASGLGFLGVAVDESRNTLGKETRGDDWEITAPGANVRTFVIAAREDRQIAAEVRALLPPRLRAAHRHLIQGQGASGVRVVRNIPGQRALKCGNAPLAAIHGRLRDRKIDRYSRCFSGSYCYCHRRSTN
jgi:acetate kinase